MFLKKFIIKLISLLIDSIRPFLGPMGNCCIYPITCSQYAKQTLKQKPFYISIPLIILRVISCNPLTALFFRIKNCFNK